MAFHFKKLDIPGIIYIESDVFSDERGFLSETYKFPDFKEHGIEKPFVQVNHSKSIKGVLRGLHFQINPMAQGKLVTVLEGKIFDVVVDIRKGSPTYGKWVAKTLEAEKKNMLYVPEGFAHGFCVCSEAAQVIYYCTNVYSPEYERGLLWNDPTVGIQWPIEKPSLSKKDAACVGLDEIDHNFQYIIPTV